MNRDLLLALKIERRCIAAAIFDGRTLRLLQQRALSHEEFAALKSTTGFVEWMLESSHIQVAALEKVRDQNTRQAKIHARVREVLTRNGVPCWEVERNELVCSYGIPQPTLTEVRELATQLWPILLLEQHRPALIDAAVLGAYVHVQRVLAAAIQRTQDAIAA